MVMPDFWQQLDATLLFKIAATLVAVAAYTVTRIVRNRAIHRIARARNLYAYRVAATRRILELVSLIVLAGAMALIWSINFSSLVLASGAILATIGIAFFAQWSILSNVTTSVIMFWRFPIHIGDRVGLLSDKDFSGVVRDLTPFFIVLTDDNGNTVTIPNTLSLQQIIVIYDHTTPEQIRERKKAEQEKEKASDVSTNG